jgi:hypothetical protein
MPDAWGRANVVEGLGQKRIKFNNRPDPPRLRRVTSREGLGKGKKQ